MLTSSNRLLSTKFKIFIVMKFFVNLFLFFALLYLLDAKPVQLKHMRSESSLFLRTDHCNLDYLQELIQNGEIKVLDFEYKVFGTRKSQISLKLLKKLTEKDETSNLQNDEYFFHFASFESEDKFYELITDLQIPTSTFIFKSRNRIEKSFPCFFVKESRDLLLIHEYIKMNTSVFLSVNDIDPKKLAKETDHFVHSKKNKKHIFALIDTNILGQELLPVLIRSQRKRQNETEDVFIQVSLYENFVEFLGKQTQLQFPQILELDMRKDHSYRFFIVKYTDDSKISITKLLAGDPELQNKSSDEEFEYNSDDEILNLNDEVEYSSDDEEIEYNSDGKIFNSKHVQDDSDTSTIICDQKVSNLYEIPLNEIKRLLTANFKEDALHQTNGELVCNDLEMNRIKSDFDQTKLLDTYQKNLEYNHTKESNKINFEYNEINIESDYTKEDEFGNSVKNLSSATCFTFPYPEKRTNDTILTIPIWIPETIADNLEYPSSFGTFTGITAEYIPDFHFNGEKVEFHSVYTPTSLPSAIEPVFKAVFTSSTLTSPKSSSAKRKCLLLAIDSFIAFYNPSLLTSLHAGMCHESIGMKHLY